MAPGHAGPSKRRKVAESCKVSKGITCGYNDATLPVSTATLADIQTRLQELERHLHAAPRQRPAHSAVPNSRVIPREPTLLSPEETTESSTPFADHSTTQFIHVITQIANDNHQQVPPWNYNASRLVETDTSYMVVPQRSIADGLVDCYEKNVYPLFPILHMPSFRQRYQYAWESRPQDACKSDDLAVEATFYATLNMVFALGCLNSSKYEEHLKLPTAECFYRRSCALLPLDALDIPSLEVVQCLLLTTNYLTFTKYSHRCCNTLAVAIRVAQTVGLHIDVNSSSSSQLKREMSRRVWHLCLTMERLISSIFGREPIILDTDKNVPLPAKIDDEYLLEDGTGVQPEGLPSILDAFIAAADIFEVVQSARKINYGSFKRETSLSELGEVLQLNEKLDQVEKSLPPHLRQDKHAKPNTARLEILELQTKSVMTRILYLRLILFRPTVLVAARHALVSGSARSRVEIGLRNEVSSICVQAALSAINMLFDNLNSSSRILSSLAVFLTISAATVIVAASLVPALDVDIEQSSSPHGVALANALQVLEQHRWQLEGAPGVMDQLEKLMETASQARARRRNNDLTQNEGETMPSGFENAIDEFDFMDPTWDLQWGGFNPFLAMSEPIF